MKRVSRKLSLNRETVRNLAGQDLTRVHGGQAYTDVTACFACQPSDRPDHCVTQWYCSGAQSCDAATCTLVTFAKV